MRRLIRLLYVIERWLLVALVALGSLILLLYLLTPLLHHFKPELEQLARARLGTPVSIGRIKAEWGRSGPRLSLGRVQIGQGTEITVERLYLDMHLGRLWQGEPLAQLRINLERPRIHLARTEQGRWLLPIRFRPGDADVNDRAGGHLPGLIRLIDGTLELAELDLQEQPPPLRDIDLELRVRHGHLTLRASASLDGTPLKALANLDGLGETAGPSGTFYLHSDRLDTRYLAPYLPAHYQLYQLETEVEMWVQVEQGRFQEALGHFGLHDLSLQSQSLDRPLQIERLAGWLRYRHGDAGWSVQIADLDLVFADHRWPRGDYGVALRRGAQGRRSLRIDAGFLDLTDVAQLLSIRWPSQDLADGIRAMRPGGSLTDIHVAAELQGDDFTLRSSLAFDNLFTRPWRELPGFSGLSGRLRGSAEHIQLDLDSRDVLLEMPTLFRWAIPLERLAGRLDWYRAGAGWELVTQRLETASEHIKTATRLRLRDPGGAGLHLDLHSDFQDGTAEHAGFYYPTGEMLPSLVAWLDQAFRAGRIVDGTAIFSGPLGDFPFDQTHNGHFEVLFDVADLDLHYQDGWPRLQEASARLRFVDNRLEIQNARGRLYDSRVLFASGDIASLDPVSPLRMKAEIQGPLNDSLRLFRESPLRRRFGDMAGALRAEGDSRLHLRFAVPLDAGEYDLDGALTLLDSTLSLPDWDLSLTDLRGDLGFTLDGVAAKDIEGRLRESEVILAVSPEGAARATRVSAKGLLSAETIRQTLPSSRLVPMAGAADFQVEVLLPRPEERQAPRLSVRSELAGMALDWPAPLGKPADQARALRVELPLQGEPIALAMEYAPFKARLLSDLSRATLAAGGQRVVLPDTDRIVVRGGLAELDLDGWLDWVQDLELPDARQAGPLRPGRLDLELEIARLLALGQELEDVRLDIKQGPTSWSGRIRSEQIRGAWRMANPPLEAPMHIDLDRLALRRVDDDAATTRDMGPALDPLDFPELEFSCANLLIDEYPLGRLDLALRRRDDGLALEGLKLFGPRLRIEADGAWRNLDDAVVTHVAGEAKTGSLGGLLDQLGYPKQLSGASAEAEFAFDWRGDPSQFGYRYLDGDLALVIGKGVMLEVDPGVSRLLGLINFSVLQRRLRLDFSDLVEAGMAFDAITGHFQVNAGQAVTDDLILEGPTGDIRVNGTTDLVQGELDQIVTLVPDLGAPLALAGTVAGGPAVGLAVLVAQRLFQAGGESGSAIRYQVMGPWDEPKLARLTEDGSVAPPPNSAEQGAQQRQAVPSAPSPEPAEVDHGRPEVLRDEAN